MTHYNWDIDSSAFIVRQQNSMFHVLNVGDRQSIIVLTIVDFINVSSVIKDFSIVVVPFVPHPIFISHKNLSDLLGLAQIINALQLILSWVAINVKDLCILKSLILRKAGNKNVLNAKHNLSFIFVKLAKSLILLIQNV